jgi:hypothetical protein
MSDNYKTALECAGANVHCFESFGSYQGDWWAKVTYKEKTFWVHGYYGSCSGCDAFEAEFDYDAHVCGHDQYYYPISDGFRDGCEECQKVKHRLIAFGKGYLEDDIYDQAGAEKKASEDLELDTDAQEMLDFIKSNPI